MADPSASVLSPAARRWTLASAALALLPLLLQLPPLLLHMESLEMNLPLAHMVKAAHVLYLMQELDTKTKRMLLILLNIITVIKMLDLIVIHQILMVLLLVHWVFKKKLHLQ